MKTQSHLSERSRYRPTDALSDASLHEPAPGAAGIPEALVQDLWKTQHFDHTALATVAGAPITVLDPGRLNEGSGPDFRGARLRIDGVAWAGDVEIHVVSGDWIAHKHHLDSAYNGVVLHVVLQADLLTGNLRRLDGSALPELVLYPHLEKPLRTLLHRFHTHPPEAIVCAAAWHTVPEPVKSTWIATLAKERVASRAASPLAHALPTEEALESLLHERLFEGLGYARNGQAMTTLAHRLPRTLVRPLDDPLDLEALHFGVASLLPSPTDLLKTDRATADYAMMLKDRFERLNHRLNVPVMEPGVWQFSRLRPSNFPAVRIAQGVALLLPDGLLGRKPLAHLLHGFRADNPLQTLRSLLRITPGAFWQRHVRLDKASRPRSAALGRQRIDRLIANAVIPVMLRYADHTHDDALRTIVLETLRQLPPEHDAVTRLFASLGTEPADAFDTQGLHQLYRTRCSQGRCLSCAIGSFLLDRS